MDDLGLIWLLGVISAVLVFGIKVGLASGLANLSKKYLAFICVGYGAGVLILAKISSYYTSQLTDLIYGYNVYLFLIMAIIMIIAGFLTIREWKIHSENTTIATYLTVIAPCPCCFGSILITMLIVAPNIGLGVFQLSQLVAIALMATIAITYFASNTLVKFINKPYPIVLGNFMLFLGIFFLLSSIVLPNIIAVMGNESIGSLSITSIESLIMIIIFVVILLLVGVFINKKSENIFK